VRQFCKITINLNEKSGHLAQFSRDGPIYTYCIGVIININPLAFKNVLVYMIKSKIALMMGSVRDFICSSMEVKSSEKITIVTKNHDDRCFVYTRKTLSHPGYILVWMRQFLPYLGDLCRLSLCCWLISCKVLFSPD
jgi:hypothetical protein